MAKKCAIIPEHRNMEGEMVQSKLFRDLLSHFNNNRGEAKRVYQITKGSSFIRDFDSVLTKDELGDYTFESLYKHTNLRSVTDQRNLITRLENEYGGRRAGNAVNYRNYEDALPNMRRFNDSSIYREDYVATLLPNTQGGYGLVIKPKNRAYAMSVENIEHNARLNDSLRTILSQAGISVGVLNELEHRRQIAGITDFDVAEDAATGLVELIRLADGIEGEKALPEEFAHFALAATEHLPLVDRMINTISQNNLATEILGNDYAKYDTAYQGDVLKLAKEAAGKLVAQNLLNEQNNIDNRFKNLFQRAIEAIKKWIVGNISGSDIQKAMYQADKDTRTYAKQILGGQLGSEITLKNISESGKFYSIQERVEADKRLLKNITDTELKRLKIYGQNPNSVFTEEQLQIINDLELAYQRDGFVEGIANYLSSTLDTLKSLDKRLQKVMNIPDATVTEKATVLRNIRNFLFSYSGILKDIREQLRAEEKAEDNRYDERIRTSLDAVQSLLNDLYVDYSKVAMPIFVDFIKPFVGDALNGPFNKYKADENAIQNLLKTADSDISFFDRWLDSMAESNDMALKIMDNAVKRSKQQARIATLNDVKELQRLHANLEKSGIKNTEWMYERGPDGEFTQNLITEIDWGRYADDVRHLNERLDKQYGVEPVGKDLDNKRKARREWYDTNVTIVDGKRIPKSSKYSSAAFKALSPAQKEYYDGYMTLKAKLDSYLPEKATTLNRAVQIRKDLVERIKGSSSIKEGLLQIGENIKEQFVRNSNDTSFGDRAVEAGTTSAKGLMDFEGNEIHKLPVYYTNRLKKASDLSLDATSTLAAYAMMANDYHEMNKVVDALELGRELIRDREVTETRGGRQIYERFNVIGRNVENKITKSGYKAAIVQKLDDFFESQVYGKYMKDEGTFGKTDIDKAKTANFVNRLTSLATMAMNSLLGISNVATGTFMMNVEGIGGEFFTVKDMAKADALYAQFLPGLLAQVGERVKNNKLELFAEKFNILHDFDKSIHELNMNRKTWFGRLFGEQLLYFMTNSGEHWMQLRTALALANNMKLKDASGRKISLWDALEVVKIGDKAAKLEIKKGVTKEDGTAFTNEDAFKFERRSAAVNEGMHGIYNRTDMNAFKRTAIGRMAMMFRNWAISPMNKRYRKASYNMDLGEWQEGYYRTFGKFTMQLAKELRNLQFNLGANWDQLTNHEKANIKRTLADVGQMVIVLVSIGILENLGDDDDNPWLTSMLEYQLRRLSNETQVFTPWGVIPEGLKIMKSPAAGVSTIEDILGVLSLISPTEWDAFTTEVERGRYQGYSKAFKRFMDSPLVPMNRAIYKGLHPEESIAFYKM